MNTQLTPSGQLLSTPLTLTVDYLRSRNAQRLLVWLVCLLTTSTGLAQSNPAGRLSPPAQSQAWVNGKRIRIEYSQPAVRDRELWGQLVPDGEVWCTGANETTVIECSDDVTLEGHLLRKGRYALLTIPNPDEWILIINKTIQWGVSSYCPEEDVLRVKVEVKQQTTYFERLTFSISATGLVSLNWANAQVDFQLD